MVQHMYLSLTANANELGAGLTFRDVARMARWEVVGLTDWIERRRKEKG